jgi:ABC-type glycerol-3-phosphate transport system permease component
MERTMAMTVVSVIPMMVVFFAAQRHFIQGIVLTGIKG